MTRGQKQTNAKITTLFNITFPSGEEGKEYLRLRELEERGTITDLRIDACGEVPTFVLIPGFVDLDGTKHQGIGYTPDFMYRYADPAMAQQYDGRIWHIVEVKGRVFKDYPLRKKLFLYFYGRQYVFHERRRGSGIVRTKRKRAV